MYDERDLIKLIEWYKTTDFNVEGHSPEDCVLKYHQTHTKLDDECDATESDIY